MPKTKYPIFKCLHRSQKGFTLIELLIVIAVLGVIAAVVVPNVGRYTASGVKAAAQSELLTVQTAIDAAMAEAGSSTGITGTFSSASDITFTCDTSGTSDDVKVSSFLRRTVVGTWTVKTTGDDVGLISDGTYTDRGVTWTYTAPDVWVKS